MLTMLIGGLWHGANWNFVIWGGYQGAWLAIERIVYGRKEREGFERIPLAVLTFAITCIGWVFFRAKTFAAAAFVIGQMFSKTMGTSVLSTTQLLLILATLGFTLFGEALRDAMKSASVKDAASEVAARFGLKRRDVYGRALTLKREGGA